MTKLDIVIGREENLHRLLVKMGQKAFVVGSPQSVPNSVSRNHCALVVELVNLSNLCIGELGYRSYHHVEAVGYVAQVLTACERCLFAIVKPAVDHLVVRSLVVS